MDNYEERIKHYIYIYIYSNFIFLITLCRFSINIIKLCKSLSKFDLTTIRNGIMNGHKSDYRRFFNGDFSKSDTSSLYRHVKSHDLKIFKFQILEILENEGFKYTKDIRQL